jgi:hypothetical protein
MQSIKLSGYLATCDKYDRMRLLINSYEDMEKIISLCISTATENEKFLKFPYTKFTPPDNGIYGECIIVIKKKYKTYWKSLIEEKRGKLINVNIKIRKWFMQEKLGISFDLIDFD